MSTGREQWFADVLTAGLDTRVVVEPDIVAHVTPAVLASSMPRDVIVKLFDAALASGTMSPVAVVETATPALLAAQRCPRSAASPSLTSSIAVTTPLAASACPSATRGCGLT